MSADKQTELTNEAKDQIVNARFTAFIQDVAKEVGEAPVGAITTVCWPEEDRVSVAVTLGKAPVRLQMRIVDLMARNFAKAISHIKAKINTTRES